MTEETPRRFFVYAVLPIISIVLIFTPSILPTCIYENPFIIALASVGIVFALIGIVGIWANREVIANFVKRLAIFSIVVNIIILWYFIFGPASSIQTQYVTGTLVGWSPEKPFFVYGSNSRTISLEYVDISTSMDVSNHKKTNFILVNIPSNGCVFQKNSNATWFTNVHAFQLGQQVLVTWKGSNEINYQVTSTNVFILDDK